MEKPQGAERRKHRRVPFIQEVIVEGVGTIRCSEISVGGMYIETVAIFQQGSTINLRFKLANKDAQPIQVNAEVRYIHEGVGIGVLFLNLPPEDHQRIDALVQQTP